MKRVLSSIALVACLMAALPALAGAPATTPLRPAGQFPDFHGSQDGPVFMAVDPSGKLWSVWAYWQAGEFDIAISYSVGRVWMPPEVIATGNGVNDLDPRIAFLANGDPIVVWWQQGATTADNRVMFSNRSNGAWRAPAMVRDVPAHGPAILGTSGSSATLGYNLDLEGGGISTDVINFPSGGGSVKPRTRPSPDGGTNGPDPMPTVVIAPPRNGPGGSGGPG